MLRKKWSAAKFSILHLFFSLSLPIQVKNWNKRRSHVAIFSVNGAQKNWSNTQQITSKKTRSRQESFDGGLVGRIQAGCFRESWVLRSEKHECQRDFFAFSNHQDQRLFVLRKIFKKYHCQIRPWYKNSNL